MGRVFGFLSDPKHGRPIVAACKLTHSIRSMRPTTGRMVADTVTSGSRSQNLADNRLLNLAKLHRCAVWKGKHSCQGHMEAVGPP